MKQIIALLILGVSFLAYANEHEHEHDRNEISVFENAASPLDFSQQDALRDMPAWKKFSQKNGRWYVAFNTITKQPMWAMGKTISFPNQSTLENKAFAFIKNDLKDFQLPVNELSFRQYNNGRKYDYAFFKQYHKNLEVLFSKLNIHFTKDKEIIAFTNKTYPGIRLSIEASFSISEITDLAKAKLHGNFDIEQSPVLKILPISGEEGYDYKLVYEIHWKGENEKGHPAKYYMLIDADDATIYYNKNKIYLANFEIQSEITDNPLANTEIRNLPYVNVRIDNQNYYADKDGNIDLDISSTTDATVRLRSDFARVYLNSSNGFVDYNVSINPAQTKISLPDNINNSAVSAFYHTNLMHDFMRKRLPDNFSSLDFQMPVTVDITDDQCNAYFDGNSINFFAEGNACYAFAQINDVVYHEYGHAINDYFYEHLGLNFMNNGAQHEGYADIWAFLVTENPVIGPGTQKGNLGSFVRRYDKNPKVYPDDIIGEVHNDGEIIAGAWWDLGQLIGMTKMESLFVESQMAGPNEPGGYEGLLYGEILFETVLADDDNNDPTDGTPHLDQIFESFGNHGILIPIVAEIEHKELPLYDANKTIAIDFNVQIDFDYQQFVQFTGVAYRANKQGAYEKGPSTPKDENGNYMAYMNDYSKGTIIDYYFVVEGANGVTTNYASPREVDAENPNIPYQLLVGYRKLYQDDFSSSGNWKLGATDDDASTGHWMIGSPNPTFAGGVYPTQTGKDHTPTNDNKCAFTGNESNGEIGANDVDDGKTTITTMAYDVSAFSNPAFSYHRWYVNDAGANPRNDYWEVHISNDGGDNWVEIENTNIPDNSWRMYAFRIKDYVELTDDVLVRFVASDPLLPNQGLQYQGGSLVEAAIDDFTLYDETDEPVNTSIAEKDPSDFPANVYPNPASEHLFIELTPTGLQGLERLSLSNILGQIVYYKDYFTGESKFLIDTKDFTEGIYILKLKTKETVFERKVMIGD